MVVVHIPDALQPVWIGRRVRVLLRLHDVDDGVDVATVLWKSWQECLQARLVRLSISLIHLILVSILLVSDACCLEHVEGSDAVGLVHLPTEGWLHLHGQSRVIQELVATE